MQVIQKAALVMAAGLMLAAPVRLLGGKAAPASPSWEFDFQSTMPLGSDSFLLKGHKPGILLMATAITPELDGWRKITYAHHKYVLARDGSQPQNFPGEVQFRVTASARGDVPAESDPLTVSSDLPLNDYLLGLRFRLRVFHALRVQVIKPLEVHLVGVPADVPYDERVYRVSFRLPRVPVQDRILLEVLSPDGERLARFHFEIM
jgi:hypothetical protein